MHERSHCWCSSTASASAPLPMHKKREINEGQVPSTDVNSLNWRQAAINAKSKQITKNPNCTLSLSSSATMRRQQHTAAASHSGSDANLKRIQCAGAVGRRTAQTQMWAQMKPLLAMQQRFEHERECQCHFPGASEVEPHRRHNCDMPHLKFGSKTQRVQQQIQRWPMSERASDSRMRILGNNKKSRTSRLCQKAGTTCAAPRGTWQAQTQDDNG